MLKLFIDTDIGSEMTDAAAVTLAAASFPYVELLGITTVTGDTLFRASAASELLHLIGRPDIPIRAGVVKEGSVLTWETEVFSGSEFVQPPVEDDWAAQLIVDTITKNPNGVTLVGIGPLTNIAKALELCPVLPELTHQLVAMGGMINLPTVDGVEVPRYLYTEGYYLLFAPAFSHLYPQDRAP